MEIGEEILFPSFFRKMLMSAFLLRFKANISKKCVATPLSFVDSNSFCKDLLFPHGPNFAQKPPYLVGTVLKYLNCGSMRGKTARVVKRICTDLHCSLPRFVYNFYQS